MKYCPYCGKKIYINNSFCPYCGAKQSYISPNRDTYKNSESYNHYNPLIPNPNATGDADDISSWKKSLIVVLVILFVLFMFLLSI